MLKIAICDDDKKTCIDLENYLKTIANENNFIGDYFFDIKVFYSIEDLYKYFHLNNYAFDIIFLSIKFDDNNMAGVQMGNTIRKQFYNETVKIIYISNYADYLIDLFQTCPFDFCPKPISYKKINDIITSILRLMNKQNKPFIYTDKGIIKKIDLFKILYFVIRGRKIEIITYKQNSENILFNGKISKIGEQLFKSNFFFIHHSYLVNYHNVACFEYTKLKLINGAELEISQRYRKSVREMIILNNPKSIDY